MNSYDECKAIVQLDLDPIKVKLMHKESGEGWTPQQASAVETEYRRFLYLIKMFPDEDIAPRADVDIFWHYHILDTRKYAVDCEAVFGHFLHHYPYLGLDEEDHHSANDAAERTRQLYEQAFGDVRAEKMQAGEAANGTFCSVTAVQSFCSVTAAKSFCSVAASKAFCSVTAAKAFCSVTAANAFCSVTSGKSFCSVTSGKAFCSVTSAKPKEGTAFCSVTTAAPAFCSVTMAGEPSAKAAFCSVTTAAKNAAPLAFCSVTSAGKVSTKPAFCSVTASSSPAKAPAFCSVTTARSTLNASAFCSVTAQKAFCSVTNLKHPAPALPRFFEEALAA